METRIKQAIQDYPNHPKPGIIFKDLTPILRDSKLCKDMVKEFSIGLSHLPVDIVVGIESRGFWFGPSIAQALSVPFVPLRKSGSLPGDTINCNYELEYGSASIELQKNVIPKDANVLIHDDLLATGGTALAAARIIQKSGGNVSGFAFIVELKNCHGAIKLSKESNHIISLASYD
jgi:adenine phosphoribosyltransferase